MFKPLGIDLFCGLGGWTDGMLAEGYDVVGFDIERHEYGEHRYPAQLVLQDVRTLDGRQFKDAALIVASPPDNTLFESCFRIQREASEAAGHMVPLVVENVKGAQKWVGRSRWNYGSFHLWGDVPALMPFARAVAKRPGHDWNRFKQTGEVSPHWRLNGEDSIKNQGGSWFNVAHNTTSGKGANPDGRKHKGSGAIWFDTGPAAFGSKSSKRKMASALMAKIPLPLSRHIAATYRPANREDAGR